MTDSKEHAPRRARKGRRTVTIGGTSQSAFAGYAAKTKADKPRKKRNDKVPPEKPTP